MGWVGIFRPVLFQDDVPSIFYYNECHVFALTVTPKDEETKDMDIATRLQSEYRYKDYPPTNLYRKKLPTYLLKKNYQFTYFYCLLDVKKYIYIVNSVIYSF